MSLPIGGFMPIPLAIMIPFMATQSLVMGEAFGKGFQYGKRKISSMSNEEFNKLTPQDIMLEQTANIRVMVPELGKQMDVTAELQKEVIAQLLKIIPDAISVLATGNVAALDTAAHLVGQHIGHDKTSPPLPTPPAVPPTNNPAAPPSFVNPPATNVPATPAPVPPATDKTYAFKIMTNSSPEKFTTAQYTVARAKTDLLFYRANLLKVPSSTQKIYTNRIFQISNTLHQITGVWY